MMRITLITILSLMFFEPPYTCFYVGNRVPKNAFPETIGKFKRDEILNERVSNIETTYEHSERPKLHSIGIKIHSVDDSKTAEQYLNLSTAKCSDENLKDDVVGSKLLKNSELQDKSGKKTGIIRICQDQEQEADNFYLEMTNDNTVFFIRTNNLYGEKNKSEMFKLSELVEFAKNIPFNSNLDFENPELNLEGK